mgnify:CR=1 FL=1
MVATGEEGQRGVASEETCATVALRKLRKSSAQATKLCESCEGQRGLSQQRTQTG